MQTPSLPHKINLWQLAAENGRLDGVLALAALPRLAVALSGANGMVKVTLAAGIDSQGGRFLKGELCTEIELICQRCLGPLRLPLKVTVSLGLVHNEREADRLAKDYEPLLAPDGGVAVADLVEDELLLALPQIPRHDDPRECEANGYTPPGESPADAEHRQSFAVLASLLRDSKRSN
ncbi:MAG: YceD family protein [Candidatus Competibacteraceae bacterium]